MIGTSYKTLIQAFLCCFLIIAGTAGAGTLISDKNGLAANSNLTADSAAYILNPGSYSINAAINISTDSRKNIVYDSAGGTLSLDNTGLTAVLLRAARFDLKAGTLRAAGGSGSGLASGLRITAGGFHHLNGTVEAIGGAGGSADGVRVDSGGYVIGAGRLIAQGGTGSSAVGLRVGGGETSP